MLRYNHLPVVSPRNCAIALPFSVKSFVWLVAISLSIVCLYGRNAARAQEPDRQWLSWSESRRGLSLEIPSFFEETRQEQTGQVVVAWRRKAASGVSSTFPTLTITEHSGSIKGLGAEEFARQVVADYRKIGIADVLVDRSFVLPGEVGRSDVLGVVISYTWETKPYLTTVMAVEGSSRYFLVTYIDETKTFEELAEVRERVIRSLRVGSSSHEGGIPKLIDEEDASKSVSPIVGFSPNLFSSVKVYFSEPPYLGWLVVVGIFFLGLRANRRREQ